MSKNLVIVESPAKAKTIEKYLGKDFQVLSSIGHIRSIVKKTKDGTPPIDIKNDFYTQYEVDPEKKKVITELKKAVKTVGKENVWLATDEDREGEAIAWHLCKVLDLPPETTKRIVFHEITKSAIEAAVKSPRTVDMNLVQAQQARQILDRIVGFELSPVVWQKVPGGKSAGRVQSPAVRLLVEREQEITAFEGSSQFKVVALFIHDNQEFKAELNQRFNTEEEATEFLEHLKGSSFTVSDITKSPGTRNPAAPFTTSTLQQEANSKLGFSSKATMAAAQKLYQAGKITYMRTDSVNLSGQAIAAATDFIKQRYGSEYSTVRKFKTKAAGAQEAHEAIRPTDITRESAASNEYDQKLYDLIRRRTLASQMSPAKLEKTTITIEISRDAKSPKQSAARVSSETRSEAVSDDFGRENGAKGSAARAGITVFDGELVLDSHVRIGVYEQEVSPTYFELPLEEAIERMYLDKDLPITGTKVRQLMSDYLFTEGDGKVPIKRLSGGQKARFQLIAMLANDPQLLILDEPTNHLDLPSIEEMETALAKYNGAILYVSHDDYFRRAIGGDVVQVGAA